MELIEIIADLIEDHQDGNGMPEVMTVLVPEACMEIRFDGKLYHLHLEDLGEE